MMTTSSRDESKKLNHMKGARIIISASGMLTGGRVMHHAMRVLPDENATIVFVGYQAAGTTGRRISGRRARSPHYERLDSRPLPRRTRRRLFRARRLESGSPMARKLAGKRRKLVFTTHGEPDAAEAMAGHIREGFGWNVVVPQYEQTIELK